MRMQKHEHITLILYTLHWLPVLRIEHKVLLHIHHCLQGEAHTYLTELLTHTSARTRSGQQHQEGVIEVQAALYGRMNKETCSEGWTDNLSNISCSYEGAKDLLKSCEGEKVCEVEINNFPDDPYQGQVIHVNSAECGRRDSTTCSTGHPPSELQNTNCVLSVTERAAQICNGRNSCSIRASNSRFGDPCGGTYKYLKIGYVCNNTCDLTSVGCEHDIVSLSCDQGQVIDVTSASYGRRDSSTCSAGRPEDQLQNTNCERSVTDRVAEMCNFQSSCSVRASNSEFGDPCVGTFKYLKSTYDCVSKPSHLTSVGCEHDTAFLRCDQGQVISVTSAYYGRRDTTTCSAGRPWDQLTNINCELSVTDKVAQMCNNRNSCSVSASNSEFGDPCVGTFKYLKIIYCC
ncbi:hypothetical protein WMY93_006846 [Mugilogobius chulae]|uniref:Rhamnose binding lectin n=1 Tax=Mugilogobius chulae TaxID=88201 RepID=A0AAW0PPR6_9GOBI